MPMFEALVSQNSNAIAASPFVSLLAAMDRDFSVVSTPRALRTQASSVPVSAIADTTDAFVKGCLKFYSSDWCTVVYHHISKNNLPSLSSEVESQSYEIDMIQDSARTSLLGESSVDDLSTFNLSTEPIKTGVLLKAPATLQTTTARSKKVRIVASTRTWALTFAEHGHHIKYAASVEVEEASLCAPVSLSIWASYLRRYATT